MKIKNDANKPEAFAGQRDFLINQSNGRKAKSGRYKIILWIIAGAAVIAALGSLCFFCPPALKNVLPAEAYYKLSGMKLLRQTAFEEAENDYFYTGRAVLDGEISGEYSVSFKKSGGRLFLSLSDDEDELFSLITDEKTGTAYFRLPAVRGEYAVMPCGVFPFPERKELDLGGKISFLTGYGERLINSASDIYYENEENVKWLCADYESPWELLNEDGEASPWAAPEEAKAFLKAVFHDGKCAVAAASELSAIRIANKDQSVTLLDFERKDEAPVIKLPSVGIDVSRGWENYLGIEDDSAQAFENIPEIKKDDGGEPWREEAVQVNLGMTEIAVKREKFGLPWSYENLPDGLPEPEEEYLLPGETLEFLSQSGNVYGVIKNYGHEMRRTAECDVIVLQISGADWSMTINKAGIGTPESELIRLMGEASWTEEKGGERLYRFWDGERLIKIDFYVKNSAVSRIRYEITE